MQKKTKQKNPKNKTGIVIKSPFATHDVRAQLDEEDRDAAEGKRDADGDVNQVRGQLRDVLGEGVGNGFLEIVKDQAPWSGGRPRWA